ncbi:zinc-binding alcohol dehydrogenase family protein [Chitinophaga sp. OAE865]|uniref:quinone oxidoreductase family protein n=1 Tax=Chitinophaga sp. OAE865 TaxID=2817898 RepID=UPI001AE14DF4
MKAAVMYPHNEIPQYVDMPEPTIQNDNEILVAVKAVAIKHFDKGRATGKHYSASAPQENGRIIGGDGVCLLDNGVRVYAVGADGMLAEKAVVEKDRIVKVPDGLSDAVAAALPNAVFGAAMALKFKAGIQPGDVVLINGATGFTGRVAVQIAKYYGAKKIIVTGRNQSSLEELLLLGADEIISLKQHDEAFTTALKQSHKATPVDIVIDYLWGHSAEMILSCLKGDGAWTNFIRFVSVGSMSGDLIQLSSAILRSLNIQLSGSGLGAWTKGQVKELLTVILPEMFMLAAEGKLTVKTVEMDIHHIAELWEADVANGERIVVTI